MWIGCSETTKRVPFKGSRLCLPDSPSVSWKAQIAGKIRPRISRSTLMAKLRKSWINRWGWWGYNKIQKPYANIVSSIDVEMPAACGYPKCCRATFQEALGLLKSCSSCGFWISKLIHFQCPKHPKPSIDNQQAKLLLRRRIQSKGSASKNSSGTETRGTWGWSG